MSSLKARDKMEGLGGIHGQPLEQFHTYDLNALNMPVDARPLSGQVLLGKHGYTLRSTSGAVP